MRPAVDLETLMAAAVLSLEALEGQIRLLSSAGNKPAPAILARGMAVTVEELGKEFGAVVAELPELLELRRQLTRRDPIPDPDIPGGMTALERLEFVYAVLSHEQDNDLGYARSQLETALALLHSDRNVIALEAPAVRPPIAEERAAGWPAWVAPLVIECGESIPNGLRIRASETWQADGKLHVRLDVLPPAQGEA